MITAKQKKVKFDQNSYDDLFLNIENNLREMGLGDVAVNKKMKDLNKILYDILLKINKNIDKSFRINKKLIFKYFKDLNGSKNGEYINFETYFHNFYKFCFELSLENMLREAINFK